MREQTRKVVDIRPKPALMLRDELDRLRRMKRAFDGGLLVAQAMLWVAAVGLIFLIPGKRETLRVSGTAQVVRDPALLAGLAAGKHQLVAPTGSRSASPTAL